MLYVNYLSINLERKRIKNKQKNKLPGKDLEDQTLTES